MTDRDLEHRLSPLLTRAEAAAYLRVSLRSFARHVQPLLHSITIGRLRLWHVDDLAHWKSHLPGAFDLVTIPPADVEIVYVIGASPPTFVKIGRSINFNARLGEIQTGNHLELEALCLFLPVSPWTARGLEGAFHRWFAPLRRSGEWFACGGDLEKLIKRGGRSW